MDSSGSSQSLLRPPPESFRFCNDEPEIGRGAYGRVLPGQLAGRPVAVKRIHLLLREAEGDEYVVRSFEEECRRMEKLNHPHLVKFLGAYRDTDGPFLVMERMAQDLRHFLAENKGTLSLQKQLQLCLDIATCLKYLHTQTNPLVHRDLNDKNILLDREGSASIADLGQSKLKNSPYEYFNTPAPGAMVFMPPEALSQNPHYNEKVDIFSFGVLMLEIATQQQPQPGMEGIGTVPERERRKVDLDHVPEGHPLKPLILGCLANDPHDRPCIMELCKQLAKFNFTPAKKNLIACMNIFLEHLNPFQAFLDQIQDCPATALTTANHVRASLKRLVEATEQDQMKVVFLGTTSNGKSTVLNALLRDKVLLVGKGSTTNCFCAITGMPPGQLRDDYADGYVKTRDSQEMKLTEVANLMKQGSLRPGDVLEIFLPAQDSNVWLNQDVVLIDSPGLGSDGVVDELVEKTCEDADVFVYVCDGTRTLEEMVKRSLEQANHHLPNLSKNLFILFNHWDQVVDEDDDSDSDDDCDNAIKKQEPKEVKKQHLQRVQEFFVQGLQSNGVLDRTFFVSGKEVCKAQENEKKGKQSSAGSRVLKRDWQTRWKEFRRFESMLHEFLSGSAIETKCGRHWKSCTEYVSQLTAEAEQFKTWCREEAEELDTELRSYKSLLAQIDVAEQTLQQTSEQEVHRAVEELAAKFDVFYGKVRRNLQLKVELYRDRRDEEKWVDYQTAMVEYLDTEVKQLTQPFEHQIQEFVIDKLEHLQETFAELTNRFEESPAQVEQDSLRPGLPTCTEMTTGYCARPWFGRFMLNATLENWKTPISDTAKLPSEVVTVEGVRHRVPLRFDHPLAMEILMASFLGSTAFLNFLIYPVFGIIWSFRPELHTHQVKGKIVIHLMKELDARKQAVKSQCLDNLRSLLESQVEGLSAALADRKLALTECAKELQQKITDHCTWMAQASSFQDQLQQEVKPCLDRFYSRYLQGESA